MGPESQPIAKNSSGWCDPLHTPTVSKGPRLAGVPSSPDFNGAERGRNARNGRDNLRGLSPARGLGPRRIEKSRESDGCGRK